MLRSLHPAGQVPQPRPEGQPALTTIVRWLIGYTVEEVERELILNSLSHYCGNRTWTANVLGISIRTLRNKINEYTAQGIEVARPLSPVHPSTPKVRAGLLRERFNFDAICERSDLSKATGAQHVRDLFAARDSESDREPGRDR
jgi:hypothetical protein